MILTLAIGITMYAALLWSHSTTVTPDGQFYLAMGRGQVVPRPYAFREVPRLLTSVMAWRVLHFASYVTALATLHTAAERLHVDGTFCALAIMALPAYRQSVVWPVLLDMPILAVAGLAAAFCTPYPTIGLIITILSALVHERAPVWCAVYSAIFLPLPMALAFFVTAGIGSALWVALCKEEHITNTGVDWLDKPLAAALAKHRGTLNDWRVWCRPLGASLLGIATASPWVVCGLAVGYGGCLLAQDRARIYSYAAFPLTVVALQLAGDYGVLIPLINWFVSNTEV